MNLYKIGEVSKFCNISIKTLRYYEEENLITPVKVDIYSGYRYYDESNIRTIYKIQFLKDLGFSLQEIRDFDDDSFDDKIDDLKEKINKMNANLNLLSSLKKQKGERVMQPFVNDENAIGKWNYVCSAISKDAYLKNDYYFDDDALMQELYFLPNGQGYWIFDRWSKGVLYHFAGNIYKYSIEGNKLFVEVTNEDNEYEITLVYERVDSKEYLIEEIERKDNTDMNFVMEENAIGSWEVIDYISVENKFNYVPNKKENLFLKGLSIMSNGDCFKEYSNGRIDKIKWTRGYILGVNLASSYVIRNIGNEEYLIMDWKSGDYVYGGKVYGCYVFKKVK